MAEEKIRIKQEMMLDENLKLMPGEIYPIIWDGINGWPMLKVNGEWWDIAIESEEQKEFLGAYDGPEAEVDRMMAERDADFRYIYHLQSGEIEQTYEQFLNETKRMILAGEITIEEIF